MIFNYPSNEDKPFLLRALERLVSPPEDIRAAVAEARETVLRSKAPPTDEEDFRAAVAEVLVERYANTCGRIGALTSGLSSIPGLGTLAAIVGTGTADLIVSMKYQIDMVTALAELYGRDITSEEERQLHYAVAGLGIGTKAGIVAAERFTLAGIRDVARKLAKARAKRWLWRLFRRILGRMMAKGVARAIPMGIGAGLGFYGNFKSAKYIGKRAIEFFEAEATSAE